MISSPDLYNNQVSTVFFFLSLIFTVTTTVHEAEIGFLFDENILDQRLNNL